MSWQKPLYKAVRSYLCHSNPRQSVESSPMLNLFVCRTIVNLNEFCPSIHPLQGIHGSLWRDEQYPWIRSMSIEGFFPVLSLEWWQSSRCLFSHIEYIMSDVYMHGHWQKWKPNRKACQGTGNAWYMFWVLCMDSTMQCTVMFVCGSVR